MSPRSSDTVEASDLYLPRSRRYDHLLDQVYHQIQRNKGSLDQDAKHSKKDLDFFLHKPAPEGSQDLEEEDDLESSVASNLMELVLLRDGEGAFRVPRATFRSCLKDIVSGALGGAVRELEAAWWCPHTHLRHYLQRNQSTAMV